MVVLAFLTDVVVVTGILEHLGLPTSSVPLSPARVDAQLDLFDTMVDQEDWPDRQGEGACWSRGPPETEGDVMVEDNEEGDLS